MSKAKIRNQVDSLLLLSGCDTTVKSKNSLFKAMRVRHSSIDAALLMNIIESSFDEIKTESYLEI